MKMNKIISLALTAVLSLTVLAGCASQSPAPAASAPAPAAPEAASPAAPEPAAEPIKIGVSMNSADQYRTSWIELFKELAGAKGYEVSSTNADNDPSKQISDVESLIQKKPDVIIIHAVDGEGIVPAVEAVNAANIPVVMFDVPTSAEVTALISDEQGLNGDIQAEYLKEWLDADTSRVANVGYIVGMYMEAAMPRMNNFKDAFASDSRFTWVAEADASWSADNAMKITEDWIQAHPDMNVFACMSDEIAIGCIQALKAANKNMDDVIVMGIDGSDIAKEYLATGELDCTAARDLNIEVGFTVESVERIYAGETVDKVLRPMAIYAMSK